MALVKLGGDPGQGHVWSGYPEKTEFIHGFIQRHDIQFNIYGSSILLEPAKTVNVFDIYR